MLCTKDYGFSPVHLDWLCPADIEPYIKLYEVYERKQDEYAWLYGRYVYEANLAAIENALAGKKSKLKYTDKPYTAIAREDSGKIAYEERMKKVKALFMQLEVMKTNFEINHPKDGDINENI